MLPSVPRLVAGLVLFLPFVRFSPSEPQKPESEPASRDEVFQVDDWLDAATRGLQVLEYEFRQQQDGSLSAPNRAHGLRLALDAQGLSVAPRTDEGEAFALRIRTRSVGRGEARVELGPAAPRLDGEARHAAAKRGPLEEHWTNRGQGLEHGWTIAERPSGVGPLTLELGFEGELRPLVNAARSSARLLDEHGRSRLEYRDLRAFDAGGAPLEAHFAPCRDGLLVIVDDSGASYPLEIDPTLTTSAWQATGDQVEARLGSRVSTAGDVNGDGFSDLLVSAPLFDAGESNEGRVFLYLGSAAGPSLVADWTAEGDQVNAEFGNAIDAAGDVDGDGYGDVLIGAPRFDGLFTDGGGVFLYRGGPAGLSTIPAWTLTGDQAGARLGSAVAGAGDVNGDGYADVAVSAIGYDAGEADEGAVFAFLGGPTGPSAVADWQAELDQSRAGFGASLAGAGDVNADGYQDLLVGCFLWDGGEMDEGRADLYFGGPAGLSLASDWSFEPDIVDARLGSDVAAAGDVDGDGYADLLLGAPYLTSGAQKRGQVTLFRGGPGGPSLVADWSVLGQQAFDFLGVAIDSAGDVNGDGYADVIIGAALAELGQPSEGRADVYLGSAAGLSLTADFTILGQQIGSVLGIAVGAAGDVDGDGFGDVIVGSSLFDDGELNEGRALLFSGCGEGLAANPAWTSAGGQGLARFGSSLASAGDVDGDGFGDVLVGAPDFDGGFADEGAVFLYLGGPQGASATPSWTTLGGAASARLGSSVAGTGDSNGDGFEDILLGARGWNANAGQLRWFAGGPLGPAASPDWTYEEAQAGARLGLSVAAAGDANGDGLADLLAGEPSYSGAFTAQGRALLFLGGLAGPAPLPAWSALGLAANEEFATSVAGAGDVNADGLGDVLVGAPLATSDQVSEGRAFCYLGQPSGPELAPSWMVEGDQSFALLGAAVSSAGDVDGDGYADVVIGSPLWDGVPMIANGGRAQLWRGGTSGLEATPSWTIEGTQNNSNLGLGVAGLGDVNGDGLGDLAIAARLFDHAGLTDSGRLDVYLGSSSGPGTTPDRTLYGQTAGAQLGAAVGAAGDVNGDGRADLLLGSPGWVGGAGAEGRAQLYLGGQGEGVLMAPRQLRDGSLTPVARLGRSNREDRLRLEARPGIGGGRMTPAGRSAVRLEWEIVPLGGALDGSALTDGSPYADSGLPGSGGPDLLETADGLSASTGYVWRARVATTNPRFPHGPWFSIAWSTPREQKVGTISDCDGNGLDDALEIAQGVSGDCDADGLLDACELAAGAPDCNANGIPDECDIASGTSVDCNANGVPDECENDCNANGIEDECDLAAGTSLDCNANGIPDECDIAGGGSLDQDGNGIPDECEDDCNGNGVPDALDISLGTSQDCNTNGIPDECDLAGGASLDCNSNDIPDECELDCNGNGVPDDCDLAAGTSLDCNTNSIPDECDIASGTSLDCNANGIPDECELDCNGNGVPDDCDLAAGTSLDCNANGVPDECDITSGSSLDCNNNGVPDECDITSGSSLDCNANGIPDECEPDCNNNGVPDDCDLASGASQDCNTNGLPDECDIASGSSQDCNTNGIPDECELDCNNNGQPDDCDLAAGTSLDCNANGVPDECDIAAGTSLDCNANGVPDECDIASGSSLDCNANGVPDECDLLAGTSLDCNANGVPDECDIAAGTSLDCNGNSIPDECDIASGASLDCNGNGVPDSCDLAAGTSLDCNSNGIPDECDLLSGASLDCNANGIPDECDIAAGTSLDCNANGVPDDCDISSGFSQDCNANGVPDSCDISSGNSLDGNANGIPDECESVTNFCSSSDNSTGAPASIYFSGSLVVADNAFTLRAGPVPNQFGLFFYSAGQTNGGNGTLFGNGLRCVGNGQNTTFRLPIVAATGNLSTYHINFTTPPAAAATILAGSTWNFQNWFRDPAAGGAAFDLSDGLRVLFQ